MSNRNTKAIISLAKNKTKEKEDIVLNEIKKMERNKEKISIYSVAKRTGVSRSFLYNNKKLFCQIDKYRNAKDKNNRNERSSQVIIKALQMKVKQLERQNNNLMNSNYKNKYFKLLDENKELKKQLQKAYKY
ncbi:hypothetical protein D4Z93_03120 [Clostridium fermenticellae]|uniref:Transposase n=1 Tax=Clostridium fermenticellae TaxID=2068654 RepID=A0A386H216_9CLOT|nr:DUF6262 family protein [Clostridium fermenticellae]AYD39585.1 hypothetical protein D4Z93_03120 [Clostridium fermenticellae]